MISNEWRFNTEFIEPVEYKYIMRASIEPVELKYTVRASGKYTVRASGTHIILFNENNKFRNEPAWILFSIYHITPKNNS